LATLLYKSITRILFKCEPKWKINIEKKKDSK
jgi:hypothetical protein